MEGFVISGKLFCVCEDLRVLAEENKGKTIADVMRERRAARLMSKVDEQIDELLRGIEDEKRRKKRGF